MTNQTSRSKPKREFCVGGPIPPKGYYALKNRPEIGKIVDKLEAGKYFVIYAPRQVGKTSLIREVAQRLSADQQHLTLYLTFQDFGRKMHADEFYRQLAKILIAEIRLALRKKGYEKNRIPLIEGNECQSERAFTELLETVDEQISHCLCLFIDEFEDIPQEVLDGFLYHLRI